jgi:hypothetical protein
LRGALNVLLTVRFLTAFTIFICFMSCRQKHSLLGKDVAQQELIKALRDKGSQKEFVKMPIDDENEAIASAEPILFKTYDKNQVLGEKPYEVYLIDNYWVLSGTLPDGMMGGTFLIIFSKTDGSVIKLTHGK